MGQTLSDIIATTSCTANQDSIDEGYIDSKRRTDNSKSLELDDFNQIAECIVKLVDQISECDDFPSIISAIYSFCYTKLKVQSAILYFKHTNQTQMILFEPGNRKGKLFPITLGIVGYVGRTGCSVSMVNFKDEKEYNAQIDLIQRFPNQKMHCIPLHDFSRCFAVLQVTEPSSEKTNRIKDQMEFLKKLGGFIGNTLRKVQICSDLQDVGKVKSAAINVLKAVNYHGDFLILTDRIVEGAKEISNADHAILHMVNCDRRESYCISDHKTACTSRPFEDSFLGKAAESGEMIILPVATNSNDYDINRQSIIFLPIGKGIRCGQHLQSIAVLEIIKNSTYYTKEECDLLKIFVSEIALYLRKSAHQAEYTGVLYGLRKQEKDGFNSSYIDLLQNFSKSKMSENDDEMKESSTICTQLADFPELYLHQHSIPEWDFNVFEASKVDLISITEQIFLSCNICDNLKVSRNILINFINAVDQHYHLNPYHNFLHAFSVLHVTYLIIAKTASRHILSSLSVLATLIAALCHDLDHPGHNNSYEIQTISHLALQHNDQSVLENHHACATFRIILKGDGCNVLGGLSETEFIFARKSIIDIILATDMEYHFDHCDLLEKRIQLMSLHPQFVPTQVDMTLSYPNAREIIRGYPLCLSPLSSQSKKIFPLTKSLKDRQFLMKVIVHAADLSGQVFPTKIALEWGKMIVREFEYQAIVEQADGLHVSYEQENDELSFMEGQLFFASRVVSTLWNPFTVLFPELEMCRKNLSDNIMYYQAEIERLGSNKVKQSLVDNINNAKERLNKNFSTISSAYPFYQSMDRENINDENDFEELEKI